MYTAKNHTEGPDKLVIGGELAIDGKLKIGDTQLKRFIRAIAPPAQRLT